MLRLEYILTSGAQYIDTGYIPKQNTVIEVETCRDPSNTATAAQCIFGCRNSTTTTDPKNFNLYLNSNQLSVEIYGKTSVIDGLTVLNPYRRALLSMDWTGLREILRTQNGTAYQYDSKIFPEVVFEPLSSFTPPTVSIYIGARNANGTVTDYGYQKFYNFTILEKNDDGELVVIKKYVPVLRGKTAGFYEEVNKTFIPSQSSTPFKAGPILYPYGKLENDADDIVHTLTNMIPAQSSATEDTSEGSLQRYLDRSEMSNIPSPLQLKENDSSIPFYKAIRTAGKAYKRVIFKDFTFKKGHIYFSSILNYQKDNINNICCYVKNDGGATTNYGINTPVFAFMTHSPTAVTGQWNRFCGRAEFTGADGTYGVQYWFYGFNEVKNLYTAGTTTYSGEYWLALPMMVDLTDAFGAGNEPSLEWCQSNLPNFFGNYIYEKYLPRVRATFQGETSWYPTYKKFRKINGKWIPWGEDGNVLMQQYGDKDSSIKGSLDNLQSQLVYNASQKDMVCAPSNASVDEGRGTLPISVGGILKKDFDGDCSYFFGGRGGILNEGVDLDNDDFLIHWKEYALDNANNFIFSNSNSTVPSSTVEGLGLGGLNIGVTESSVPKIKACSNTVNNINIGNVNLGPKRTLNTWIDVIYVRKSGKYYIYQDNDFSSWGDFAREVGYASQRSSSLGLYYEGTSTAGHWRNGYIKDFYIKRKNYDNIYPHIETEIKNDSNLIFASDTYNNFVLPESNPPVITNTMIEYISPDGNKYYKSNAASTSLIIEHSDIASFSTGDFAIFWEEYQDTSEPGDSASFIFSNAVSYSLLVGYKPQATSTNLTAYASSTGSSWNMFSNYEIAKCEKDRWYELGVVKRGNRLYFFSGGKLYARTSELSANFKIVNPKIMFGGNCWSTSNRRTYRNIRIYKSSEMMKGVTIPQQSSVIKIYDSKCDLMIDLPLDTTRDHSVNNFGLTSYGVDFSKSETFNGKPCAYFNGASWLTWNSIIGEELGANDFTIEWWEKPESGAGSRFASLGTVNNYGGLLLGFNSDRIYVGAAQNSWNILNNVVAFSTTPGTWTHWATVRKDGVFKTYRNGQLFYTSATNTAAIYWHINCTNSSIGRYGSNYYKGYMANFKIYRGCKYNDAFTVTPPKENS